LKNQHQISKILAISGYFLIGIINFLIFLSPMTGYELSIYSSTPTIIWILIEICFFIGIILIIHQLITLQYKQNSFWLVGFFLMIITRINLLIIPYNRGYYTWSGDNITHLGLIKDIVLSGSIGDNNFYPITHILLSEIELVSNASVQIVNYSTTLISITFIFSIFLLSRYLFSDKKIGIIAVTALSGVLFNQYEVFLMPNGWSVLFIPLTTYFILRSVLEKNFSFSILALIFLIIFPLFHPLSALILIFLLMIFVVTNYIFNIHTIAKKEKRSINKTLSIYIALLTTIFIFWILTFTNFFQRNIRELFDALLSGGRISEGGDSQVLLEITTKLNKADVHGIDVIILFLKMYGDDLIFLTVFIIGSIICFFYWKKLKNYAMIFSISLFTFFLGVIYCFSLLNIIPGLENIGSQRFLAYMVIFTPIYMAAAYSFFEERLQYTGRTIIVSLIVIAIIISNASLFISPYVNRPTNDVTTYDVSGMTWIIENKDVSILHANTISSISRFADAILGSRASKLREDINKNAPNAPDHFGYDKNPFLGNYYNSDRYLTTTQLDTIIYSTVYKSVGRFNNSDFFRLSNYDDSVDRIYDNGECKSFYINTLS